MPSPAQIAAAKIPVPVADNQFKANFASSGLVGFSAVGGGTIGGVRTTALCSAGTANSGADILFNVALVHGKPQTKTNNVSKIHGIQARASECCPEFSITGA